MGHAAFVLWEISIARIGNKWIMIEGHLNTLSTLPSFPFWWDLLTMAPSQIQVNYPCA
jgi:hypothetical protein